MDEVLDPKFLKRQFTGQCDFEGFRTPTPEELAEIVDPGGTLWTSKCENPGRYYKSGEISSISGHFCDEHARGRVRFTQNLKNRAQLRGIEVAVDNGRIEI